MSSFRLSCMNAPPVMLPIAYTAGLAERALCFGWVCGNSHGFETMRLGALRNIMLTLHRFVTTR